MTTPANETRVDESTIDRRGLLRAAALGGGSVLWTGSADGGRGNERGANEYLVGTNSARAEGRANERAEKVRRTMDFDARGKVVHGRYSPRAAEELRQRDDVRYVERDLPVEADGQAVPWGVDRTDADAAHGAGETGEGAAIAVLDTGVDPTHETLGANVGVGRAETRCTGDCEADWDDDHGHGTHVAGTASAADNGVGVVGTTTDATIHPVKVLSEDGSGWSSDVAAGIEWATDNGCDVINMSLGGLGDASGVREACQYAADRGVLLIASAGNDGPCSDCVGYPAAYDTVIAVSATDDDDSLAEFSSTGPEVDLAAPGVGVYSSVPADGYEYWSGTSMAAPHVAGAGAHLLAKGYSNADARARLGETAEDVGLSSNRQGDGLLDVAAALDVDNAGPTCAIAAPDDGATVGGTVTVQVDAGDREDADSDLDVEVSIGGRWVDAGYAGGSHEVEWDTTEEDDGDVALRARATDADGATTYSSERTVTVDNGQSSDDGESTDGDGSDQDDGGDGGDQDDDCSGICIFGIDVDDFAFDVTWAVVDFTIDFTIDVASWAIAWVLDAAGNVIGWYRSSETGGGPLSETARIEVPAEHDAVQVRLEAYNARVGLADVETRHLSL